MYHNPMNRQEMNPYYGYPTPNPAQAPAQYPTQLQVPTPAGGPITPSGAVQGMPLGVSPNVAASPEPEGMLPLEQSYVENILRFNRGKMANVYMTFEYNPEWPAKVFRGTIVAAGRDHIILRDAKTGNDYLLLMVSLDFVEFEEPIEYVAPVLPGNVQTVPGR
jgi:spore germination protein Q